MRSIKLNPVVGISVYLPSAPVVAFSGIVFWLAIWVFSPINSKYVIDYIYIIVGLLFFFFLLIGSYLGFRRWSSKSIKIYVQIDKLSRYINRFLILGFIGLAARTLDRLGRGVEFSAGFMANREEIQAQAFSAMAVFGVFFGSLLLFLPLLIFIKRSAGIRQTRDWIYLFVVIAYPLLSLVFLGSRSGLLVFMSFILVSAIVTKKVKIRSSGSLYIGILLITIFFISGFVFISRTEEMGMLPIDSLTTSGYSYFVVPYADMMDFLYRAKDSWFGFVAYVYINFSQYYTHGMFEFLNIVSSFNSYHTYGLQIFFIPIKLIARIFLLDGFVDFAFGNVIRTGVYTTLMGPLLYDFGIVGGWVACLLIGYGVGAVGRRSGRVSPSWLPLYLFFIIVFFFAPVVSLFVSAEGAINVIVGVVFCALLKNSRVIFIRGYKL